MRQLATVTLLGLVLGFSAVAVHAQTGDLSAVHGIPGLAEDVDVYVDGSYLFSFGFGDTFGPVPVDANTYDLEVYYQGSPVPGLSGTVTVEEGGSYTAVAHLDEGGAIAPLAVFENQISPLTWRYARLQIHHLAAAPTVDAALSRGRQNVWPKVKLVGLSNGDQATAIDFTAGNYNVGLLAGGVEVFNTGKFKLRTGDNLAVYAVGVFPDTFELVYLPLD